MVRPENTQSAPSELEPEATETKSLFDGRFTLQLKPNDRQLTFSSTSTSQVFARLEFDDMPTACALSHSDTTLFIGTARGRLVAINICYAVNENKQAKYTQTIFFTLFFQFQMSKNSELLITSVTRESEQYAIYHKHEHQLIERIILNADGSRLLTGDASGRVLEWDAYSGSMIKDVREKRFATYLFLFAPLITLHIGKGTLLQFMQEIANTIDRNNELYKS